MGNVLHAAVLFEIITHVFGVALEKDHGVALATVGDGGNKNNHAFPVFTEINPGDGN